MRGHDPIAIPKFNGLWTRGGYEAVPLDHFTDLLNVQFIQDGVTSRDGFDDASVTIGSVLRTWTYKIYGQADRQLILDDSYNIWDSTNLATPILTVTNMTDFAAVGFAGRAYISPSNGSVGLAGEKLYVYDGSGVARAAAGTAPTGTLTAVDSATVGHVEKGTHLFAVVFETKSGFLTAPGPATFARLDAAGDLSVDLSGIPTGDPAIVAARRIIATRVIPNYNGDQENSAEFFFVPNGRIANNTDTTLTVSFYDADLMSDASYLFDLFDEIPAMVWLSIYHGRLVGGGENANPSVVRVSEAGQPEAINEVTGLLTVDPANTSSPVTNGSELRDTLYLFKKTHTYASSDNGSSPSTWNVIPVDKGLGTDVHGVALVADNDGANVDALIVASRAGLEVFTGVYSPNMLSWKILDTWKRINKLYFNTVSIMHDVNLKRIYVNVPLDNATSPSHILMGDYSNYESFMAGQMEGAMHRSIKWTIWTLANNNNPTTISLETSTTDNSYIFRVGCKEGNIYNLEPDRLNDYGYAIPTPMLQFGIMPDNPSGDFYHTVGIRLIIKGSGTLTSKIYDRNKQRSVTLASATLTSTLPNMTTILANFRADGFIPRIELDTYEEWFKLYGFTLFAKPVATSLPM